MQRKTIPLNGVVTLLPTPPAACNANDGESPETWLARRERVKLTAKNGNGMGMPLAIAAQLTPLDSYGPFAEAVARQEEAFGHPAPEPTDIGPNGSRRLSAKLPEWMMGLSDGYLTEVPGVTRNGAIKMAGNGVCPQQAEAALRLMLQSEHNEENE